MLRHAVLAQTVMFPPIAAISIARIKCGCVLPKRPDYRIGHRPDPWHVPHVHVHPKPDIAYKVGSSLVEAHKTGLAVSTVAGKGRDPRASQRGM